VYLSRLSPFLSLNPPLFFFPAPVLPSQSFLTESIKSGCCTFVTIKATYLPCAPASQRSSFTSPPPWNPLFFAFPAFFFHFQTPPCPLPRSQLMPLSGLLVPSPPLARHRSFFLFLNSPFMDVARCNPLPILERAYPFPTCLPPPFSPFPSSPLISGALKFP